MKVLLSRPEGRNQVMADKLKMKGVDYMITPLLSVIATQDSINPHRLTQADSLIFISTNAVKFAAITLNNQFPNCRYYAVGQATADALAQYDITAEVAPENSQDSEGLLSLTTLHNVAKQHIVIVRGIGGRETIEQELTLRQAHVSYWEVYQRAIPNLDTVTVCNQWQLFGIDTIIVTSGEVLENLIKLVPKELFAWLLSCHIIVPSNRVEQRAKIAGFNHVTNANGANTQAILQALPF